MEQRHIVYLPLCGGAKHLRHSVFEESLIDKLYVGDIFPCPSAFAQNGAFRLVEQFGVGDGNAVFLINECCKMVQRMFWLGISLAEHLRGDAVDGISREVAFEEIARHSTHHLELQVAGIRVADVAHHLSEKRNRGVFVSRFGKRPAQIVGASEFHHQRVFDANESARVDLLKSCCHLVQPSVNPVGAAGFITRETSHIIFFITRGIKHQRVGCLHMALKKGFPSEGAACEKHLEMGVFRLYQQATDIVEEHERSLIGVLAPGIVDTFIDSIKQNRNLHPGTHCLVVN